MCFARGDSYSDAEPLLGLLFCGLLPSAREPSVVSTWASSALSDISSSFTIFVLFWPFSFKDSKGNSLPLKLYITTLYLCSLCV